MTELIESIRNSNCLEKNGCDYSKLKNYIESLDNLGEIENNNKDIQQLKKSKRKKHKKKSKLMQLLRKNQTI